MLKYKYIFTIVSCFIAGLTNAQHFNYKAEIPKPDKDGFYKIVLSPAIVNKLNDSSVDIRLKDTEGNEIPFLSGAEVPVTRTTLFKEYKILENKFTKRCCTSIVLENTQGNPINNISLKVNNSDVYKTGKLTGSDDLENWYIIKDNYLFRGEYSTFNVYEIKVLNFPLSNYRYYKIDIRDSILEPLKIISAGYYDSQIEEGKYQQVEVKGFKQSEDKESKITHLEVYFKEKSKIDYIKFNIEGPVYYLREANVIYRYKEKKEWRERYGETFTLGSHRENIIHPYNMNADTVHFQIHNHDNAPLTIKGIGAGQLSRFMTAYLKGGMHYTLYFGSSEISAPDYDLVYFKDSIPAALPEIIPHEIVSASTIESVSAADFFISKWWIWTAIVVVILLLGYMTIRMMKEMKDEV